MFLQYQKIKCLFFTSRGKRWDTTTLPKARTKLHLCEQFKDQCLGFIHNPLSFLGPRMIPSATPLATSQHIHNLSYRVQSSPFHCVWCFWWLSYGTDISRSTKVPNFNWDLFGKSISAAHWEASAVPHDLIMSLKPLSLGYLLCWQV